MDAKEYLIETIPPPARCEVCGVRGVRLYRYAGQQRLQRPRKIVCNRHLCLPGEVFHGISWYPCFVDPMGISVLNQMTCLRYDQYFDSDPDFIFWKLDDADEGPGSLCFFMPGSWVVRELSSKCFIRDQYGVQEAMCVTMFSTEDH